MRVLLFGLERSGFVAEAAAIRQKWQELLRYHEIAPEPEYYRCYPDDLLQMIAAHALRGTAAIGSRLAATTTSDPVHTVLNQAWTQFWNHPDTYTDWEKNAVANL
jgi:hypothetical protein